MLLAHVFSLRLLAPLPLAVVAALFLISPGQAGDPGTPHFPDLRTLTPSNLSIENTGTQRLLRFTTAVANLGDGPLELRPLNSPRTRVTVARQRIYTHDAGGVWAPHSETTVGYFQFHPEHHHWHFGDFATYELRNVARSGAIGPTILASSGKITFCMVDSASVDATLPHSAPFTYGACEQTLPQGISVGWADVYPAYLPGQTLDVTSLSTGTYWLVMHADPSNRLREANDGNNSAALKIVIRGNDVYPAP